jgi:hypothetical protein
MEKQEQFSIPQRMSDPFVLLHFPPSFYPALPTSLKVKISAFRSGDCLTVGKPSRQLMYVKLSQDNEFESGGGDK